MPARCGALSQWAGSAFIIGGISSAGIWWVIRPESRHPHPVVLVVWATHLLTVVLGLLVLLDLRWWCRIDLTGGSIWIKLAAIVFVIPVGLLFAIRPAVGLWRGDASRSWPATDGRIVSSDIKISRTIGYYTPSSSVYLPHIRYEYSAGGRTYTADRFAFGAKGFTQRDEAERVVERYPVGERVLVHYDPRNPRRVVLEPGVNSRPAIKRVSGLGLLLVLIGVLLLLVRIE